MADPIVPDSIEPVVGRRCWGLAEMADGGFLLCSAGGTIWPSGQPLEAKCAKAHTAPTSGCTCGIYALAESEPWPYYSFEGATYPVWGEVLLWGVVVEGSKGLQGAVRVPEGVEPGAQGLALRQSSARVVSGCPDGASQPYPEVDLGHRD